MTLTTVQNYTEFQARREAIDILEEEANQLAGILDKDGTFPDDGKPHRVRIAIAREMQRLRTIANALKP